VSVDAGERRMTPPVRRGSREQRREATLRALSGGAGARCAYCGRELPEVSPRGGRPTPYCPVDPERYGNWGAKVITCAMLDEQREIWVHLYGPDQPMTAVDLGALDNGLAALVGALEPVHTTVAELSARVTGEAADALAAKAAAEDRCQQARDEADQARAERDRALSEAAAAIDQAAQAREQAANDRAEREAAERRAAEALKERDQAVAEQRAAEKARDDAHTVREQALDKVSQSQALVTELQGALDNERTAAAQQREGLRLEHAEAMQQLRDVLTRDADARVRSQAEEFDQRLRAAQAAAAERADALTEQLAAASRAYAEALAPLHDQIGALRQDVAREQAAGQRLAAFRATLAQSVDADEPTLREAVRTVLA
jgi:DNA repair exonuclease SbcCD ATPase subunit